MASNAGQSARQIVVKTKEAMEGGVESMKKFEMPKVTMAQVEDATAIAGGAVHDAGVATGKAATTVARLTGIFVSAMIHGVEEIDENEEEVIEEAAE
jgi:chemotaxis protein CheY-P-specific phosphatase CheC